MGSGGGTKSGSEGAKKQDFRLKEQKSFYGAQGGAIVGGRGISQLQKNFQRNIEAAQQLERRAAEGSIKSPIPSITGAAINTLGGFFNKRLAGQLRTGSTSATPVTAKFGPSQNELVVGVVTKDGVYSGRQQFNPKQTILADNRGETVSKPDVTPVVTPEVTPEVVPDDTQLGFPAEESRRRRTRRFGAGGSVEEKGILMSSTGNRPTV
tara:strand:- start:75 stop:701 length:627 start_codon:yes stop_codon:yes gene_type:complete